MEEDWSTGIAGTDIREQNRVLVPGCNLAQPLHVAATLGKGSKGWKSTLSVSLCLSLCLSKIIQIIRVPIIKEFNTG